MECRRKQCSLVMGYRKIPPLQIVPRGPDWFACLQQPLPVPYLRVHLIIHNHWFWTLIQDFLSSNREFHWWLLICGKPAAFPWSKSCVRTQTTAKELTLYLCQEDALTENTEEGEAYQMFHHGCIKSFRSLNLGKPQPWWGFQWLNLHARVFYLRVINWRQQSSYLYISNKEKSGKRSWVRMHNRVL